MRRFLEENKETIIVAAIFIALACFAPKIFPKEKDTSFENISWVSAWSLDYKLIRPIEFKKGSVDAYVMPLKKKRWYIASDKSKNFLLPVPTSVGKYSFIKEMIKEKIAVLDVVETKSLEGLPNIEGLASVETFEILCPGKGYKILPFAMESGQIFAYIDTK